MAAQALPGVSDADAPEWVHLLPTASGAVQTGDARGPYHIESAQALIDLSFEKADRLPIDENHSLDLAAPKGHPSPARGWITEMQIRRDGIWGRVEWTAAGRELVTSRAYRGLSPVILHDKAKKVWGILRASLVNKPNLRGLVALNQENNEMSLSERLAELLGLEGTADDDVIVGAVTSLHASQGDDDTATALQSQLGEIGVALGCAADADPASVLTAAHAVNRDVDETTIAALQAELVDVTSQLNSLTEGQARSAATAFVDAAIRDARVGVKPQRDRFIAMHMRDAAEAEAIIGALPRLGRSGTTIEPPAPKDGEIALNAEQTNAARLLGLDPKKYAETLKSEEAAL